MKEMERNIDPLPLTHPQLRAWLGTQACALTGNRTGGISIHRLALNPLSHNSQGYGFYSLKYSCENCKLPIFTMSIFQVK